MACLALIWYFEPPIQTSKPSVAQSPQNAKWDYLDYYVKILTDQPLDAGEIEIAIRWDPALLEQPTVRETMYARLLSDRPDPVAGRYLLTITPKSDPPKQQPINTPPETIPLVRLGFKRLDPALTPAENAVEAEAVVVTTGGIRQPLGGVSVIAFNPPAKWRFQASVLSPPTTEEGSI